MANKNVQTIFPLTQMQQAMLFHHLADGRADPGRLLVSCRLTGPLNADAFDRAWQKVIVRHAALRTSVHWADLEQPLQVVHRHVEVQIERTDLRHVDNDQQHERCKQLYEKQQCQPLDLTRAPAMRVALVRTADQTHELLWSCHHMLLDGWSGTIVLADLLAYYDAQIDGRAPDLPATRPYAEYATWLRQEDWSEADAYWRNLLDGAHPVGLSQSPHTPASSAAPQEHRANLSESAVRGIASLARRQGLSPAAICVAAWAATCAKWNGVEEALFGVVVSGRGASVPGIETMVGPMSNVIPVRLAVPRGLSVTQWLGDVHRQRADAVRFEQTPLPRIQTCAGPSDGTVLFDSLLVVENQPWDETLASSHLAVHDLRSGLTTAYPLTCTLQLGTERRIQLTTDPHRFNADVTERLLRHVISVLEAFASERKCCLCDLPRLERPVRRSVDEDRPRRTTADRLAPRNDLERRLVEIWRQVLGRPVGVRDNYFQLGGQSLQAMDLIARIESELGVRLPMAVLFERPTIAQLAERIDAGGEPDNSWAPLVKLQDEGDRPPFYCVHGIGGEVMFLLALAKHFAPHQPLIGLQAVGLDGVTEPDTDVQTMARRYVRAIRDAQPSGPYHLGGYSSGGLIAYEMARLLCAQGQRVGRVVIFDTGPARGASQRVVGRLGIAAHALWMLPRWVRDDLLRTPPQRMAWRVLGKCQTWFRGRTRQMHRAADTADPQFNLAATFGIRSVQPWRHRFLQTHSEAMNRYQPGPYDGTVTVIRARTEPLMRVFKPDLGWSSLAGHVKIERVPGSHDNIFDEPYVRILAGKLMRLLAEG